MQIIVNDVHIRYEDSDADPAHPIAVGIMLENISVQSTDENWVRRREYTAIIVTRWEWSGNKANFWQLHVSFKIHFASYQQTCLYFHEDSLI